MSREELREHTTSTDTTATHNSGNEQTTDEDTTRDAETCGECGGSTSYNDDRGETVCDDCGLVVEDTEIDRGPEWRAFNTKERNEKSRVGSPTTKTQHDKGLSTTIGWQNKDAYGNSLSAEQRETMSRLRKWDERYRTKNAKERGLKQALSEIQRMCSALDLNTQIEETASMIYRQCVEKDLLPGRSIEGMTTACVYAATRQCDVPRTLEEIYPVSRVYNPKADENEDDGTKEIDRAYRYICNELNLKMKPVDPRKYLSRFVDRLNVDDEQRVINRSKKLIALAEENKIHSGKSPVGIAGGAIYLGALLENQNITQQAVADAANTSVVTVRNRYQEIASVHNKLNINP